MTRVTPSIVSDSFTSCNWTSNPTPSTETAICVDNIQARVSTCTRVPVAYISARLARTVTNNYQPQPVSMGYDKTVENSRYLGLNSATVAKRACFSV